jgi:hypothetical protein
MVTKGLTLVRERKAKRKKEASALGGPSESHYFYEYYVSFYQWNDAYVEGCGLGTWLVNFLCKFTSNLKKNPSVYNDTGILGAELIKDYMTSEYKANINSFEPLEKLFLSGFDYIYIITTTFDSKCRPNDNSIMLTVIFDEGFILTARPEKFLGKYEYYKTQMEENKKSFAEIDYGDDEVLKEGYFSEDQLLIKFLYDIQYYL